MVITTLQSGLWPSFLHHLHTYWIDHYNLSVKITTKHRLGVLISFISGGTFGLKSIPNDIFVWRNFSWQFLFTLRVFTKNLLRGNLRWNIVSYLNRRLTSSKPAHYLLDNAAYMRLKIKSKYEYEWVLQTLL